ncbi:uncharacterized protein LOC141674201 [Apium graveolens]|uniref:uncharacterized protein LOC141674201 n=1 Tax=Apium graveolens TaxID=4045 RepID=UPI003D7ACE69
MCPSCNNEPETALHTLVTCQFSRACWDKVGMSFMPDSNTSFLSWLDTVLNVYTGKDVRMKVMVCWALWKARNELVWDQKGREVTEIITSAATVLNQWSNAQDKNFDCFLGFITQEEGDEQWTLPTQDTIKLNTDAAIFEELNRYSFSLVARNHRGKIVDALAKCHQGTIRPEMAEIMGIREALSWVKTQPGKGFVVETDSLVAVQAIRSSAIKLSYLGRIIEDCKTLLGELKDKEVSLRFIR